MSLRSFVADFLLVVFCAFMPMDVYALVQEPVASITMTMGDVLLKRVRDRQWQTSSTGMFIYGGDKLRTRAGGKAEIKFLDGSIVYVGNDSEIEFVDQNDKKDNQHVKSIFMFFGSIFNKVEHGSLYEVETVHALATVRGTEFDVKSSPASMEIWVRKGLVDIENEHGLVQAIQKTKTFVQKSAKPVRTNIDLDEFPKKIQLDSKDFIDVSYSSHLHQGQWYKVSGIIKSKETGLLSKLNYQLSLVSKDGLRLSLQGGVDRGEDRLDIESDSGRFEFYVLSKSPKGEMKIMASKGTLATEVVKLTFKSPQTEKVIFVEYLDENKKTKRLNMVFKYKLE